MKNKSQNVPVDLETIIAEEEEYKKEKHKIVDKYSSDLENKKSKLKSQIQTAKENLKKLENRSEETETYSKIDPKKRDDIQKQISEKYKNNKEKAVSYLKDRFFS